jgi:hypothetical protein
VPRFSMTLWHRTATDADAPANQIRNRIHEKALPEKMFTDTEQPRLTTLRNWVLDHEVTEIEMSERQFWNFAQLHSVAEKPWVSFMGRPLRVPKMPEDE